MNSKSACWSLSMSDFTQTRDIRRDDRSERMREMDHGLLKRVEFLLSF